MQAAHASAVPHALVVGLYICFMRRYSFIVSLGPILTQLWLHAQNRRVMIELPEAARKLSASVLEQELKEIDAAGFVFVLMTVLAAYASASNSSKQQLPWNPYREKLYRFYEDHNPERTQEPDFVKMAEKKLIQYHKREEELFRRLRTKYEEGFIENKHEQSQPAIPVRSLDDDNDEYHDAASHRPARSDRSLSPAPRRQHGQGGRYGLFDDDETSPLAQSGHGGIGGAAEGLQSDGDWRRSFPSMAFVVPPTDAASSDDSHRQSVFGNYR
jgi:hypothetical protein